MTDDRNKRAHQPLAEPAQEETAPRQALEHFSRQAEPVAPREGLVHQRDQVPSPASQAR